MTNTNLNLNLKLKTYSGTKSNHKLYPVETKMLNFFQPKSFLVCWIQRFNSLGMLTKSCPSQHMHMLALHKFLNSVHIELKIIFKEKIPDKK